MDTHTQRERERERERERFKEEEEEEEDSFVFNDTRKHPWLGLGQPPHALKTSSCP